MSNARIAEQDMTKDFAEIAHEVVTGVGLLQRGAPDTMKAFGALSVAATALQSHRHEDEGTDGTRDRHRRSLRRCIAYHTKMAHQHGATREEVAETVALAIYMGGGPAAVYGGDGCAHTISLPAQCLDTQAASKKRGK